MLMDENHVSVSWHLLEFLQDLHPSGLQCVLVLTTGMVREELDFPSSGSFNVGPGCCTLRVAAAALSCIPIVLMAQLVKIACE